MNPIEELDKLLKQRLESIPFQVEKFGKIPMPFVQKIIEISSIADFKCDLESYKNMIDDFKKMNFFSISFIINRFFEIKPYELGLNVNEYYELMCNVSEVSAYWNSVVAPIQEELQNKIRMRQVNQKNKILMPKRV